MNYIRKTMSRAAFGSSTLFTPARVKREMGSMIKDPQIRERERERQTAPPYIRKQTYSYMLVTWIVACWLLLCWVDLLCLRRRMTAEVEPKALATLHP